MTPMEHINHMILNKSLVSARLNQGFLENSKLYELPEPPSLFYLESAI